MPRSRAQLLAAPEGPLQGGFQLWQVQWLGEVIQAPYWRYLHRIAYFGSALSTTMARLGSRATHRERSSPSSGAKNRASGSMQEIFCRARMPRASSPKPGCEHP